MDWLIRILWRQSHAIGLVPSLFCAAAWLTCGGVVVRSGVGALWLYPVLAWGFWIVIGVVVALGGLVSFSGFLCLISNSGGAATRSDGSRRTNGSMRNVEPMAQSNACCFLAKAYETATLPLVRFTFRVRGIGSDKLLNGRRDGVRKLWSASPISLALTPVDECSLLMRSDHRPAKWERIEPSSSKARVFGNFPHRAGPAAIGNPVSRALR